MVKGNGIGGTLYNNVQARKIEFNVDKHIGGQFFLES